MTFRTKVIAHTHSLTHLCLYAPFQLSDHHLNTFGSVLFCLCRRSKKDREQKDWEVKSWDRQAPKTDTRMNLHFDMKFNKMILLSLKIFSSYSTANEKFDARPFIVECHCKLGILFLVAWVLTAKNKITRGKKATEKKLIEYTWTFDRHTPCDFHFIFLHPPPVPHFFACQRNKPIHANSFFAGIQPFLIFRFDSIRLWLCCCAAAIFFPRFASAKRKLLLIFMRGPGDCESVHAYVCVCVSV